jgi:diguanylate cyclase (GGDEF)-like protein
MKTLLDDAAALVARVLDVDSCAIVELPHHHREVVGHSCDEAELGSADSARRIPRHGIRIIIRHGEEPAYGCLEVRARHDHLYGLDELRFLRTVASIIAAAARRSVADTMRRRNEAELRHRAFHDSLTGLPNRALFEDRLRHAASRAQREGAPVAVLLIDLDGFKAINDTFGHAAGDQVLRQVADRLKHCLREGDTAARLGGDEFAIVLEGATDAEAADVAGRISDALAPTVSFGSENIEIRASVGAATACSNSETMDALITRADAAMYADKRRLKNQLQLAQSA